MILAANGFQSAHKAPSDGRHSWASGGSGKREGGVSKHVQFGM